LILASLSKAARKVVQMQHEMPRYFDEAQRKLYESALAEGKAEGKAEGQAKALLTILAQRGLKVTAEQRRCIVDCTELATLERWLGRALLVRSVAELLVSKPRGGGAPRRPTSNGRRSV
jgi:predicted transposase YdaD